jgi:hypothetical protein
MSTQPIVNGTIRECCSDPANLEAPVPAGRASSSLGQKADVTVRKCRKCGARHYRMIAEPGCVGASFK